MTKTLRRVQRFLAIWRLSGRFELALNALLNRLQETVLDFLQAGGRVTRDVVIYRDSRLPRGLFAAHDIGGLLYFKQLMDYGAQLSSTSEGQYVATLPNGLRFEATAGAFVDTLCMLAERFVTDEYAWLDPAGRVVIDVGANIADSVLYFAKRGAAYVYGYEPNPAAFAAAERNLGLNGIENAELTQVAVLGEAPTADHGQVSFAELVDRAGSQHPGLVIICKIDCEGCEFDIFAPGQMTPAAFNRVSQIMIEYHWRAPEPLVTVLESLGFQVETTPAAPGVGWIRARKPAGTNLD